MSQNSQLRIFSKLAEEANIRLAQVIDTVQLLDDGSSVPFIARYRKEATGGLDDNILRNLEERLSYLRELEDRRATILQSIEEQGKLTPELAKEIDSADTKQRLEDLYLPYKPKRRTKAQIAREAGIEPLALSLLNNPNQDPKITAADYLNHEAGFADDKSVLDGAKQILMELFAENAELVGELRQYLFEHGYLQAKVIEGKEQEGENYRDWFDYAETISSIPSHRALAIFRGRNENILQVKLILDSELSEEATNTLNRKQLNACEMRIAVAVGIKDQSRLADSWLLECVRWTWRVKLQSQLELELINQLKNDADEEAISVFARNLKNLLLAAPAGNKVTMGLDPGIRTGVKVAVIDAQGKLLATTTIYPHQPRCDWTGSIHTLAALCSQHQVKLIAIGNGTASRETDKLVSDLIKQYPEFKVNKIIVSEAGASVYSASEFAAKEFPELDVSLRGAVSIARRLQDPLAELVKIDPKSIGVGQYQHDVSQNRLAKSLSNVVEDCVNAVGVDVNTASIPLLTAVSGLNNSLASNIVNYRDVNGRFKTRDCLKKVPRLGDKTFEQAIGFLRINDGTNPLDASAVHPETYPLVEEILHFLKKDIRELMGNKNIIQKLNPEKFINQQFGLPTIQDILRELEKPGRDPRPEFKTAHFTDGVETIKDLRPGMLLEGVVTNVANFGAFVDIGVHQDGLVHISALSYQFIKDPAEIVKTGEIVKVKVVEVDVNRGRISLTMRLNDPLPDRNQQNDKTTKDVSGTRKNFVNNFLSNSGNKAPAAVGGAMSEAFSRLKK